MDKPMNRNIVVAGIFKQLKGESDAMEEYQEFLGCFTNKLKNEDKAVIEEIVADEMNHSLKLLAMAKKYSMISPTEDDLQEALRFLAGRTGSRRYDSDHDGDND
jgi:rubrerythrin